MNQSSTRFFHVVNAPLDAFFEVTECIRNARSLVSRGEIAREVTRAGIARAALLATEAMALLRTN